MCRSTQSSSWTSDRRPGARGEPAARTPARPLKARFLPLIPAAVTETRAVVEPAVLILVRRDSQPGNETGPVRFDGPLHLAGGLGLLGAARLGPAGSTASLPRSRRPTALADSRGCRTGGSHPSPPRLPARK